MISSLISKGDNMKNYEINEETLAIISLGEDKTKILEKETEYKFITKANPSIWICFCICIILSIFADNNKCRQ